MERLQQAHNRFIAKLEEWGVFLEPSQYDELKRCHDAIEHFLEIFPRQGQEMERDYAITRKHFWDSYSEAVPEGARQNREAGRLAPSVNAPTSLLKRQP